MSPVTRNFFSFWVISVLAVEQVEEVGAVGPVSSDGRLQCCLCLRAERLAVKINQALGRLHANQSFLNFLEHERTLVVILGSLAETSACASATYASWRPRFSQGRVTATSAIYVLR